MTSRALMVGDRGRLVLPAEIRERHGWETGTALVAIDTDAGLLVISVDEALAWMRQGLEGRDVVGELLAERRAEAEQETP